MSPNEYEISNEDNTDEIDQVELEKLSQKETNDDDNVTNDDNDDNVSTNEIIFDSQGKINDDIIPNAIVIKNIPFAIKKEQLLDIIDEMNLPLPYAFNYHFDNGIFRGLAFANFTTAEETVDVIDNLNGKEINGRKLKVEYKKMLPQAERERIEREKREKRGQLEEQHRTTSNLSLQSLGKIPSSVNMSNSNHNNGNGISAGQQLFSTLINGNKGNNTGGSNLMASQNTSNSFYSQHSQSQFQSQQGQQQIPPFGYIHTSGSNNQSLNSNINNNSQVNQNSDRYYAPLPSASTVPIPPQQLDFNDPDTLELYSQLLLFKDREKYYTELAYPIGLSGNHKRVINVLCSYLNLVEVYDPRFVIIKRKVLDQSSLQTHLQQQGQMSIMHPLQPSSTGGSMNRSHSYTSLLQAHASATAAAAANSNDINSGIPNFQLNTSGGTSLLAQTAQHSQTLQRTFQNQSQSITSPTPMYSSTFHNNEQAQTSNQSIQSPILSGSTSQSQPQQSQQQSFLRQGNPLTPSSRIPSGYSSNTQLLNSSNPLLRNSGLPPNSNQQSNTTQRILSSLHNNPPGSPSQLHDQIQTNIIENPLLPQNTNGSVHSNFSVQSFHDDPSSVLMSSNGAVSGNDGVYSGMSIGLENGLEHHLSRSLSGLDVSGSINNNSTSNKKGVW